MRTSVKMHRLPFYRFGYIQLRILTFVKLVWSIFALALAICEILIFLTFDLEDLGQGHMA